MAEENNISAPASETTSPQNEAVKNVPGQPEKQELTTLHERTIAALSYVSFLAIIPFYLKKDSEFCRFHGKQGMLLCIVFFIAKIISVIDLLFDLVLILQVATFFYMGFAALSGRWKKLPFGYNWASQLEEALRLKTKEEEMEAVTLKPNQVRPDDDSTVPPTSPPNPPVS